MDAELLCRREAAVTRLTLNRPHKANALSATLVEALIERVQESHSDGTRLLVFDGEGAGFCAGFDFGGFEEMDAGTLVLRFIRIELLLQMVYHAPFATMALAHGKNFGAGADLVCSCTRRVAAPQTTFRMPGLQFGIVLGTRRLAHRVGADAAREVLESSATFDAAHALKIGFCNRIASREEWPNLVDEAGRSASTLPLDAAGLLHERTLHDSRDADMADIAISASVPGLKDRIRRFRSH